MAAKSCAVMFSLVVLSMAAMANSLALANLPVVKIKVQGTIFCLSSNGTTPLLGATAQVRCEALGRHGAIRPFVVVSNPADHNGVYLVSFSTILPTGERLLHCKVMLNASPSPKCNIALNLNGGITGASLKLKHSLLLPPEHAILFFAKPLFFSPSV